MRAQREMHSFFNRGQRMLARKANAGSTNQRAERPPLTEENTKYGAGGSYRSRVTADGGSLWTVWEHTTLCQCMDGPVYENVDVRKP